jgi:hypothetical protein
MTTSTTIVQTLLAALAPDKRADLINQLEARLDALNQEKEEVLGVLTIVRDSVHGAQKKFSAVKAEAVPTTPLPLEATVVTSKAHHKEVKEEEESKEQKKRRRRTGIKQRYWKDIKTYIFEELQKAHRLMNCIELTHMVAPYYGMVSPRLTQEKKLLLKTVTNYAQRMATGSYDTPIVLERVKMMGDKDRQKIWYYAVK